MRAIALEIDGQPMVPDRGGYTITMREDAGAAEALRVLAARPRGGTRLHVGWGSFRNLDVVAAAGSSHLLVCDLNAHQLAVWRAVDDMLAEADTAEELLDALAGALPRTPPLRQFATSTREWLRADLDRPESWLWRGAPERFDHVRALFRRGAAGIACLDVRAPFDRLARRLRDAGLPVDTLYLSNLPYMMRQPRGFFGEPHGEAPLARMWSNLRTLAADDTRVVRAERLAPQSSPDDLRWRTELSPFPVAMRQSLASLRPGA